MKITIQNIQTNAVPHRLYDLSIEDISQRRKQSIVMPSASDAFNYLGVLSNYFMINRKPGKRIWSNKLGKHFAVRIETERND